MKSGREGRRQREEEKRRKEGREDEDPDLEQQLGLEKWSENLQQGMVPEREGGGPVWRGGGEGAVREE